jgi:plasmid stability protein
MAQLLVRNLDDDVVASLKRRAADRKRSLQAEIRDILTEAANPSRGELLATIDALRARSRPRHAGEPSAVDMIREDRDTR